MTEEKTDSCAGGEASADDHSTERLTDVEFWRRRQSSEISLPSGGARPLWLKQVADYLPASRETTFLEVGVVPGAVLMYFASTLGYKCTGIDFSPRIRLLPGQFRKYGVDARFIECDFFSWQTDETFDVVYSGGFIEHFTDCERAIKRHWDLIAPGGLLLVTVPTLTPVQRLLRKLFIDSKSRRELQAGHNASLMGLNCLRRGVESCPGAEVLVASYAGEMTFWFGHSYPGFRKWAIPLLAIERLTENIVQIMGRSSSLFSPLAVVLARKAQPGKPGSGPVR